MNRKLIILLCLCFIITLLQGCGSPKSALNKMEGFKIAQEILPTEDSDVIYLYSTDTDNNSIWRYDCSLNGNKIGDFHLGTYQIARIYKEVGVHQLKCKSYGDPKRKYAIDERLIIKANGNERHYVEFNQGFMRISSIKIVDGSNFKPKDLYLTNNCTDCYHKAPKRFPKYD